MLQNFTLSVFITVIVILRIRFKICTHVYLKLSVSDFLWLLLQLFVYDCLYSDLNISITYEIFTEIQSKFVFEQYILL